MYSGDFIANGETVYVISAVEIIQLFVVEKNAKFNRIQKLLKKYVTDMK